MGCIGQRAARGQLGVSLSELMVVIALLALAAMVAVPLTTRKINELRLRSAADEYLVSLRAARMIAVTAGREVSVTLQPHPANSYSYTDSDGRERSVTLPPGVRIDVASTREIVFRSNGSLQPAEPATTIIRAKLPNGNIERWIVDIPLSGIPKMSREAMANDP